MVTKLSPFNKIKLPVFAILAILFLVIIAFVIWKYNSSTQVNSSPTNAHELIGSNIHYAQSLRNESLLLQETVTSLRKNPQLSKVYVDSLQKLNAICGTAKRLYDTSQTLSNVSEGIISHNHRQQLLCSDLKDLISYSYQTFYATSHIIELREDKSGLFSFLHTPSSSAEIVKAATQANSLLVDTENHLEYEGHSEMITEVRSLAEAFRESENENTPPAYDKLTKTKSNILGHQQYYWNNFARLGDLIDTLNQQISLFCEDAKTMNAHISSCR